MKRVRSTCVAAVALACGLAASPALAQFDNSVWPGFRGAAPKRGAVSAAGPSLTLGFRVEVPDFGTTTPGGFTVASNGDIYFKAYSPTNSRVYRLNPATGAVLASSADFAGNGGNYGGVAIGTDALYVCIYNGAGNTKIVKLNKTTLATITEFTNAAFLGLRGTPLIGSVPNTNGNVNLYIHDRNGAKLHCVDSVTGNLQWSYSLIYDTPFGQAGPQWLTQDGKQAIGYFGNGNFGPGAAIKDNGDSTFTVLWDATGPGNFNWWGSGALSTDGTKIYVTTFNDPVPPGTTLTDAMWAIKVSDGSIAWSGGGGEANHFGRPAVIDTTVYAGSAAGRVYCYEDQGTTGAIRWIYQNNDPGEFTAVSAVKTPAGVKYIYAVQQDTASATQNGRYVVLRDDGATVTELLDTTLNGALRWSLFSNCAATLDSTGAVWVAGGRVDDPTPGSIYKFVAAGAVCYPNCDNSTTPPILNVNDFICFQSKFAAGDTYANCDNSTAPPILNVNDFICFQTKFAAGCR